MDPEKSLNTNTDDASVEVLRPNVLNISIKNIALIAASFIGIFYFYHSVVSIPSMTYLGKKELTWKLNKYCHDISELDSKYTGYDSRHSTLGAAHKISCESNWFDVAANTTLHVYYQGDLKGDPSSRNIIILRDQKGEIVRRPISNDLSNGWQRRFEFSFTKDESVLIELYTVGRNINHSMLLNKADLWQSSGIYLELSNLLVSEPFKIILSFLMGCLLVFACEKLLTLNSRRDCSIAFGIFFLMVSFIVQFRNDVFFHLDEWIFVEQTINGSIFLRHNEHFVPLARLIYKIELLLFGAHYEYFVACSALLLSINAWLLSKWFRELFKDFLPANAEWILGLLYLINISHTETVQWVLCQGTLLSVTFALGAGISLAKYFRSGKASDLINIIICLACSAYSFTLGFTILGFLTLQWVTQIILERKRYKLRPSLYLFSSLGLSSVILLYIRKMNTEGFVFHEVIESQFATFSMFKNFFWSGSFFGTFLRGSGLFPIAEVQRAYFLATEYSENGFFNFRMNLANIGVGIYLLISIFYLLQFKKQRSLWSLAAYILGSCWLFIPMLMTAYGRSNFGDENALAFRYQAFPILGLFMILIPIVSILYQNQKRNRILLRSIIFCLLIALQIHSQLSFVHHFSDMGAEFRLFNQTYCKWKTAPGDEPTPLIFSPFHQSMMDLPSLAVHYETVVGCES